MSTVSTRPPAATTPAPDGPGTWSLSRRGVATVVRLELRQRVRSTRWPVLLGVWVLVVGVLSWFIRNAAKANAEGYAQDAGYRALAEDAVGATMFGVIVLLVLGLGSLIAPALSASSINGDRANGVLATLQTTLLTPAEIAIGKLLAAWFTALALLATATPFILWAYVEGGTSIARLLVVLALLAVTLLVVCAIGLGWSAVTARTTSSVVLTYLTVAFIGVGLPLLFALSYPLVTTDETISVTSDQGEQAANGEWISRCVTQQEVVSRSHTERTWWLLAGSPGIVVADAAPPPSARLREAGIGFDVLTEIRQTVRDVRLGPTNQENWCYSGSAADQARQTREAQARLERQNALPAAWPWGLGFDLAVGAAFTALAVQRLRTPTRRLPKGTRVA